MLFVKLLVNENLLNAEFDLNQANSDNIIERCREYLLLLTQYRDELYKIRSLPEISQTPLTPLARELNEQVRTAIRSAVEITTRERNKTESLLESFTSISGYEAVETFNRLKYKGFETWELRSGGAGLKDAVSDQFLAVSEAVETASLLRREAYLTDKTTFFRK